MTTFRSKKVFLGLSPSEMVGIFFFYFFFSFLYHVVLWYNRFGLENDGPLGWLNFRGYWFAAGMQYSFYFVASILIWWIATRLFAKQKSLHQILIVVILIPISIFLVRAVRYQIIDYLEMGRLRGPGAVWDLYIPSLFLLIQFGCYFAYRYFRENQRKLKIEGELRQAALKSELSAIKAQLNPHFLYNVFNTINASIPPENERTRTMIAQLADMFRYQLQATVEDLVTLRDELDFVSKYLELERARFEDRLAVEINVPEELMEEKVPPMIIQPLVENSVKHGLSSLIEGGKITITIFRMDDKLRFEIADTGVGVPDTSDLLGKGVGLTNTVVRLQKMYDSTLEILDNDPKGLKIQFSI